MKRFPQVAGLQDYSSSALGTLANNGRTSPTWVVAPAKKKKHKKNDITTTTTNNRRDSRVDKNSWRN
jgi:hypothetical protein